MCLTSNISPLFLPNKRIIFLTLKTSGTDFKTELLRYSVGYLYPYFWMIVEKNWQTLFKEKIISGLDSIHIRMIFSITKSGSTGCDAHILSSPSSSTMVLYSSPYVQPHLSGDTGGFDTTRIDSTDEQLH